MRILVEHLAENPITLLRRAGYVFQHKNGPARNATHNVAGEEETSFIRPFARSGFPRFHCYAKVDGTRLLINLHLDQKRETYGTAVRHHGEYGDDGPVAEEARRLLASLGENAKIVG